MRRYLRLGAAAGAAGGLAMAVVLRVLGEPAIGDAIGAPATLVWRFRIATLGGAAAYWSVLGLAFGWLCVRAAVAREGESLTTPV